MKKAALIAAPIAVLVLFPLLMLFTVAGVGGITATACTPTTAGRGGAELGIGTLNWRGAHHYTSNPHPGERPYAARVPHMVDKINTSGASIIGFQEFERPQARAFLNATHGQWGIVAGKIHGKRSTANAIAYQPGRWHVDQVRYVSIRYGGSRVSVPLVRFTSTTGAAPVWVLNTHNPAQAVHGTKAMRDAAVRAEAGALRQRQAAEPGTPVFLTGDMNDQARFKRLFLSLAGPGWSAANPTDRRVDWILGGPGVGFTDTVVDQSTNDRAHRYTDHPFVHTTAQLPAGSSGSTAGGVGSTMPASATGPQVGADGGVQIGQWTLDADEYHNAQTMVSIAAGRGGTDAALVAITAALTESGLSTDPGSLGGSYGILQQTPSAGWGTQSQVMDVTYATNAFLDHLARVPRWRSMPAWQAAQAVQRSGAGQSTNGQANYGPKVAQAQAVVAALADTVVPAASTCTTPNSGADTAAGEPGDGSFTPNTQLAYVGPYDPETLMARMQQVEAANGSANVDPFFGTEPDGSWYRDCQHFVANLDGRASSGYSSAQTAWNHFLATGAAHPATGPDGMSPPVGAWLYYGPNHVAVYLGNNLVAGTDTWGSGTARIGPASDLTDGRWHLPYLGWVAPGDRPQSRWRLPEHQRHH